jgi:flagellar L-ring protein precursor FlgH
MRSRLFFRLGVLSALGLGTTACSIGQQLTNIGRPPALRPIVTGREQRTAFRQIHGLPMPPPDHTPGSPDSLWRPGARQFFKDERARAVGDIVTVNVNISDQAQVQDATNESRNTTENAALSNFFGAEAAGAAGVSGLGHIFKNVDPSKLVNTSSQNGFTGSASTDRQDTISTTIAAMVTQVLPNGNLVIYGNQEVRVNYEVRDLTISGIIRREDITSDDTINQNQIAEERISYGGRGQLTQMQQPPYGDQLYNILFPF